MSILNEEDIMKNNFYNSSWVRPIDVMKSRKLKAKSKALKARLSTHPILKTKYEKKLKTSALEKNPFKCSKWKNASVNSSVNETNEDSNDSTILELLNSEREQNSTNSNLNFSNFFSQNDSSFKERIQFKSCELQVDWSLKMKIRFFASKPFQWKHTFKTSEEASGTTGFVRCLNSDEEIENRKILDTSSNAQFYQCCLFWQHPNLPFISLFPRNFQKNSSLNSIFGSNPSVATSLHKEWSESLRSLYQLLRVRQCPYFYVCGPSFTCLFRAAGAAGFAQTHALITPTTKGFREAMKREGVEFSMPLNKCKEEVNDGEEDEILPLETEEPEEFLETLGLETSQFPTLNNSRLKIDSKKQQNVDGSSKSLVYVEDVDLQGLINFILNCDSCISTTGSHADIPPTLLSPVAFHGGTLKSLKINGSNLCTWKGEKRYTMEIVGPILPTTVLNLTSLLSASMDEFSVSLASQTDTTPFSSLSPSMVGRAMTSAFATEGLVDCGLGKEVRRRICCPNESPASADQRLLHYREIRYENGEYSCSNELEQTT